MLINPGDCLILLGSVVGCFEGIGLVLPIQVGLEQSVLLVDSVRKNGQDRGDCVMICRVGRRP